MPNVQLLAAELRTDGCGVGVESVAGTTFTLPYIVKYRFFTFGNPTPLQEEIAALTLNSSGVGVEYYAHHRSWFVGADACQAVVYDSSTPFKSIGQFITRFPETFTQEQFNAAVQANVNAVVGAYQTQITELQAQISQLQQGNVNLQQLEADGTILLPKRRTGTYTIKDFTVLNAIYRTGNPPHFNKRDLDFIDVQMLSVQQAVRKMYQVGVAKQNDLNTSAIFRRRSNRLEEYSARIEDDFVEYLFECVRIINYCVDEIRFRQSFNLNTPTLLRIIEPKP